MSRIRTTHKVSVESSHIKPHWDYECDCYSFQNHCIPCTLQRSVHHSKHKDRITIRRGFSGKLFFIINGEKYKPTQKVKDWFETFYRMIAFHRPDPVILLFKSDKTLDLRVYPN